MKITACLFAAVVFWALPPATSAQVVINEFQYDDTGTPDDREFVELYNAGTSDVDISGWTIGGYDTAAVTASATLPAGTTIPAGGYYVLANAGVLNVNLVVAASFLGNNNAVMVLRDAGGTLVDAVASETNKGVVFVTSSPGAPADSATVAAQVGPGIFGNHQGPHLAGTPLNSTVSLGRFVDGRDTNNNGRDFGLRPATPGTTNAPGGTMTSFTLADPVPDAPGTVLSSMAGSFVPVRVIDPAVADVNNPNVIIPPYAAGSKAYVGWDPTGGGNGNTSQAVFPGKAAGFTIRAYLETTDLPVQSSATGVPFRGSEVTLYGLGGGDALTNFTDLDSSIEFGAGTLPGADVANGFTGIAWVYERVGAASVGGPVSEKLYLVDANDGGDADFGGNTPMDWAILTVHDLSPVAPGWFELSIIIDAAGNGVASFNGQSTPFTAPDMHSSAFNVGYRENLQLDADGTPDALLRPPTFTISRASIADLSFAAPTPGAVNLTISVASGQTIGVEYSQTLQAGSWLDLGNVSVTGGSGTFSDSDAARLARPRGFYRAFLR